MWCNIQRPWSRIMRARPSRIELVWTPGGRLLVGVGPQLVLGQLIPTREDTFPPYIVFERDLRRLKFYLMGTGRTGVHLRLQCVTLYIDLDWRRSIVTSVTVGCQNPPNYAPPLPRFLVTRKSVLEQLTAPVAEITFRGLVPHVNGEHVGTDITGVCGREGKVPAAALKTAVRFVTRPENREVLTMDFPEGDGPLPYIRLTQGPRFAHIITCAAQTGGCK